MPKYLGEHVQDNSKMHFIFNVNRIKSVYIVSHTVVYYVILIINNHRMCVFLKSFHNCTFFLIFIVQAIMFRKQDQRIKNLMKN